MGSRQTIGRTRGVARSNPADLPLPDPMLRRSLLGVLGKLSSGAGLVDADYGDITVSGGGTVMTIDNSVITDAKVAAANKDGADGTPSMRRIGAGAGQVCAGNDSRLNTKTALVSVNTSVPGGNTVSNTVAETAFSSTGSWLANTLEAGQTSRVRLFGYYNSAVAVPTLRFRFKIGSDVVLDTTPITTVTLASTFGWWADIMMPVESIGAAGSIRVQGVFCVGTSVLTAVTANIASSTAFVVNTTVNKTLTCTVQWGTADASNKITLDTFANYTDKLP